MNDSSARDSFLKSVRNVSDAGSLKEAMRSKPMAKLGDVITNTSYSLAKTLALGHPDSIKVSKNILAQALKDAGLRELVKPRANAHDIADAAEAAIAYAYVNQFFTIEEMAAILFRSLEGENLNDRKIEEIAAIWAFTELLTKISDTAQTGLD